MKNKRPSTFSSEQKADILAATAMPGCIISDLAKSYGIGRGSIYAWIRQQKQSSKTKQQEQTLAISSEPRFLEVAVRESPSKETHILKLDSTEKAEAVKPLVAHTLSKALLIFSNFSLEIKGNLSSSRLISILKILEDEN